MGNRAFICPNGKNYGVYLHWNGGRDSVEAFLKYCELKGYDGFENSYGIARFCQVVGNFFGGVYSIGIEFNISPEDADMADNGIYYVEGWKIVGRAFNGVEQHNYTMKDMLTDIDSSQPESERLGEYLTAEEVLISEVKPGDTVYFIDHNGAVQHEVVVGICSEDKMVNGTNVKGMLFINKYSSAFCSAQNNINNYLRKSTYRIIRKE